MSTNNTYQHVSNESKYVKFDPEGSAFPQDVTDVQTALSALNVQAVQGINIATEDVAGIAQLATQQEVLDGKSTNKIVTPATLDIRLQHPQATEEQWGLTKYATNDEALLGADNTKSIVTTSLKFVLDDAFTNRVSTETTSGVIKLANTQAAQAGVDDTTAMTPLKTHMAINAATALIPTYEPATESIRGIVRLATVGQAQSGDIREGYAISPYTFYNTTASQHTRGVVKLGTQAEVNNSDGNAVVTGMTLNERGATTTMRGVVRVTTQAGVPAGGDGASALSWDADVIHTRGGQGINGQLNVTYLVTNNIDSNQMHIQGQQVATVPMLNNAVPVGTIVMWSGDTAPPNWVLCHGGTVPGAAYPQYRDTVGGRFGGDWNNPGIPDMRGLFVRGAGTGGHILNNRGTDGYGKEYLGNGCDGLHVGGVQAQQMSYHKHAGGWGEYNRHEAPFGASVYQGYLGTRKYADWDNASYFTNDGYELGGARDAHGTLNRPGLIGGETRPWNISLNYIIKIA